MKNSYYKVYFLEKKFKSEYFKVENIKNFKKNYEKFEDNYYLKCLKKYDKYLNKKLIKFSFEKEKIMGS